MEEKRKFFRLDVSVEVRWTKSALAAKPSQVSRDQSRNLSEFGICLILFEKVEKGQTLHLEIVLPSAVNVKCLGQVRWIKEFEIITHKNKMLYEAGLELLDLGTGGRQALKAFIMAPA